MAQTFSLAPNPHWVVIDNFSKLPIGAVIYTFSSENPSVPKTAYEDSAGAFPFGEYIQGYANGTFPPIYWAFDSAFPEDIYYIQVWDKLRIPGGDAVMLWDFDGLSGGGSGGGGVITNNLDLENLVINGQFFNHTVDQPVTGSSVSTLVTLAPSNHDGFVGTSNINKGPVGPDIIFAKQDQSATDSISFVDFPLGSNDFGNTPTPKQYVKYTSDASGTENYKFVQWPIVKGLQNLQSENVSIQLWTRLNGGSTNVNLYLRQFFGNGGAASADAETFAVSINVSNPGNWNLTKINGLLVPGIGSGTLGTCGNDALYLQLRFPASEAVDLDFILPAIYLGNNNSTVDFHTQDYVNSIANSPRTGDIRTSINAFQPYGWVLMNDGTIGNASSNATARKNIDTYPLFDLMWNLFQSTPALAPMRDSAGTILVSYGASSIADFTANRQITLPRNVGRVMAGAGPLPVSQAFTTPVANTLTIASSSSFREFAPVAITGSSNPSVLPNRTYYVRIPAGGTTLTLWPTSQDAQDATNQVLFVTGPTGTVTFPAHALGQFIGDETHLQAANEVGVHSHTFVVPFSNQAASRGGSGSDTVTNNSSFNSSTNNNQPLSAQQPFNIMQPTVYMNVFIKL